MCTDGATVASRVTQFEVNLTSLSRRWERPSSIAHLFDSNESGRVWRAWGHSKWVTAYHASFFPRVSSACPCYFLMVILPIRIPKITHETMVASAETGENCVLRPNASKLIHYIQKCGRFCLLYLITVWPLASEGNYSEFQISLWIFESVNSTGHFHCWHVYERLMDSSNNRLVVFDYNMAFSHFG